MQSNLMYLLLLSVLVAGGFNVGASDVATPVEVSVMDLGADNFTAELSQPIYSGGHFLIEFYAHWCPHCQHYKPTFEKIGRYFNGSPRPEPTIWVARLDCALKDNYPVCDKFKVKGYPTLFLGKTEDFVDHKTDELTRIAATEAPSVVTAINSILGTAYKFEEKTTLMKVVPIKRERGETRRRFDSDDVERATVELFERLFESHVILSSTKVRAGFMQWVDLLAEAHPSVRCRKSCRYLHKHIEKIWPKTSEKPSPRIARFHICSRSYKKKSWGGCAGSIPDKRGFTCGLWQLFHALSVGIAESDANLWVKGVRSFAEFFFGCEECAKNFLKALDKDEVQQLHSRRELIMWLWRTHNKVNARLSEEERTQGTADPAFPKVQWPPHNLCPECIPRKSTDNANDWNEEQVLFFLKNFYSGETIKGETSITNRKDLRQEALAEAAPTDVFDSADATALELNEASSFDMSTVVFVGLLICVILAVRRNRKRKLAPRKKDLL